MPSETAINQQIIQREVAATLEKMGIRRSREMVPTVGGKLVEPPGRHRARRHGMPNQNDLLANPELAVKEEYRKPGWRYLLPVREGDPRQARVTQAYIASKRFHPVPFEHIDTQGPYGSWIHPNADGTESLWISHILVAISPEMNDEIYIAPEDEALDRLSDHRATYEEKVYEASRGSAEFKMEKQEHPKGMVENLHPIPGSSPADEGNPGGA